MASLNIIAQRQMNVMKPDKAVEAGATETPIVAPAVTKNFAGLNSRVMVVQQTPPLALDIQSQIGRQLQAVYDEVLHEPVPDRFLKLLRDLDRKKGGV